MRAAQRTMADIAAELHAIELDALGDIIGAALRRPDIVP
jgi:hypothetical protein